jgi:lipopolysaccharide heptosyltransferase II
LDEPRRIACFHLNQVGDLLFSLPAIHSLRACFPEAQIVSVARPHLRDLLELSHLMDKVIERPRRPLGAGFHVAAALRRERFDLALLFSTSLGMSVLARITGAPVRVGFGDSISRFFVTHRVPRTNPPSMQNNLRLVEAIGCPVIKRDYSGLIHPGPIEQEAAESVLKSAGVGPGERFAVLAPGTSWRRELKCWSDEGFAQVADMIARDLGMRSVVVGISNGCTICDRTASAVDLIGKTSLSVLAAVIERASVFIGVDSGVMHLAAAVKTPVVALFGPSDPEMTGPQGETHRIVSAHAPCRPCHRKTCDIGRECMERIVADEVISAAYSIMSNQARQASTG